MFSDVSPALLGICATLGLIPFIAAKIPRLFGIPDNHDAKFEKLDKSKLSTSDLSSLNAKLPPTEFGGPWGAAMMPVFLPLLCFFLYFSCNKENLASILPWSSNFFQYNVNPFADGIGSFFRSIFSLQIFIIYLTWVFAHWVGYLLLPGKVVEGTPLRAPYQNVRLKYKLNATLCHGLSIVALAILVWFEFIPATFGYDNFVQLLTSAWLFSMSLSVILYVDSLIRVPDQTAQLQSPLHLLSQVGYGDILTYDFWMGRTLNPRLGFLDLKYVCELRPGLILWSALNISMAAAQYKQLGHVSLSMLLVCCFQAYYVLDSHLSEQAILTTMDIRDDGFGFMLVFGDLAWVPFTYTMQSRYLIDRDPELSLYAALAIIGIKLLGLYIFRSSNNEKNRFRTNPEDPACKHLKYIQTKRGSKLLCSGWWGTSRHINYFGDVIMALSWSLPCGFGSILPYFYPIYFAALLINREQRDNEKCHRNYGKDWEKYCQMVPYRIIPYVY